MPLTTWILPCLRQWPARGSVELYRSIVRLLQSIVKVSHLHIGIVLLGIFRCDMTKDKWTKELVMYAILLVWFYSEDDDDYFFNVTGVKPSGEKISRRLFEIQRRISCNTQSVCRLISPSSFITSYICITPEAMKGMFWLANVGTQWQLSSHVVVVPSSMQEPWQSRFEWGHAMTLPHCLVSVYTWVQSLGLPMCPIVPRKPLLLSDQNAVSRRVVYTGR